MRSRFLLEVVKFDEQVPSTKLAARRIIHGLCNRSLLEYDPQSRKLQIHPLVQSFLEHTSVGHPQLESLWKAAEYSFTKCYMEMTEHLCDVYWTKNGAKDAMEEFHTERMNLEYVLNRPIPEDFQLKMLRMMDESFLFFRISMNQENCFGLMKNCKGIAEKIHGYASLESLLYQLLVTTILGLRGDSRVTLMVKKSQQEL